MAKVHVLRRKYKLKMTYPLNSKCLREIKKLEDDNRKRFNGIRTKKRETVEEP